MARAVARQRIRRKDIKAPDEFLTLTGQAMQWLQVHRQQVTWGGGIVALLLAVLGLNSAFRAARLRDASADLGRALSALRADDMARASNQLSEVAQRWNPSLAGQVATILQADAELRRGNYDAAITSAESVLKAGSELPPYLQQQAQFTWAVALEAKGQWNEAAEKYATAGGLSGPYRGPAILGEARARQQLGDADRARELFRRYVEEFPDMPDRDLVEPKGKS